MTDSILLAFELLDHLGVESVMLTWAGIVDSGPRAQPESTIPALVRMTDCISDMPPAPKCSMQIPY